MVEPQSNQRGIETQSRTTGGGESQSLNRTSVGLKQVKADDDHQQLDQRLNRTSVGLKHHVPTPGDEPFLEASIEPAWD